MQTPTERFREHLGKKRYGQLDDCWLELLDSGAGLSELLELAQLAGRYGPEGKAPELLSILADALREEGRFSDQLVVLRRQAEETEYKQDMAEQFVDCFRRLYADLPELERLLQKSGLGYGDPLAKALGRMDRYLSFVPGTWLYDPQSGPAQVLRLDLLLDRVSVRKSDGTNEAVGIDAAQSRFRVTDRNGFYSQLANDRPALEHLAREHPAELVRMFLRDIRDPATVEEIKNSLVGVVGADNWESFWDTARRRLAGDAHVVAQTRPARSLAWSDRLVSRPSAGRSSSRGTSRRIPGPSDLASMTAEETTRTYRGLGGFAERKRFIENAKAGQPESWGPTLVRLFNEGKDRRARGLIERELSRSQPRLWSELLESTVTRYRQTPDAFVWLTENAVRLTYPDLPGVITRVADLLESISHRSFWADLRGALTAGDYRLLAAALAAMDETNAQKFAERVDRLRGIEAFRRDEIRSLISHRFPGLLKQDKDDVILSTAPAIDKARRDLERMVEVDLPRTAEEIARARAHGDLSENYEYKAAKEKQARLMRRVNRLRRDLARARPLEPVTPDTSQVVVGSRVRLHDADGDILEYSILGPWDSDPDQGVISYLAPLGRQLLDRLPGDSVEIDGRPYTIDRIEPAL